jgi:F0F1-type ATP synthase membrane subunit b/b'
MKVMNPKNLSINVSELISITIITQIIIVIIFMVLLWLFYKLIYGILLKKLNKNYTELAKLDHVQ